MLLLQLTAWASPALKRRGAWFRTGIGRRVVPLMPRSAPPAGLPYFLAPPSTAMSMGGASLRVVTLARTGRDTRGLHERARRNGPGRAHHFNRGRAMTLVRIHYPPTGPRLFLLGYRCHHGAAGCLLGATGAAAGNRLLILAGIALMIHDRADWREWWG